jgi:hypothetical protein
MEKGTKGEGAPRGQDESATGRNEAATARRAARRSPRPTAARWGPRAAPAAGSPRTMFFRRYRFSVFILPAVFAVLGSSCFCCTIIISLPLFLLFCCKSMFTKPKYRIVLTCNLFSTKILKIPSKSLTR